MAQPTVLLDASGLVWRPAPPPLPRGASVAVLQGDPGRSGPFTVRLRAPAGYRLPPHFHLRGQTVTVLRGSVAVTSDGGAGRRQHSLAAGGFYYAPPRTRHAVRARTASELQISGEGPFEMVYLDVADDRPP